MRTRSRLINLLIVTAVIFAVGVYLRLEAYTLCTYHVHMPDTAGTALNATVTDDHQAEALVEISRVLLWLAAALVAMATAAWMFLPDFRMAEYMGMMKNWPSGPGRSSSDDPDFPV